MSAPRSSPPGATLVAWRREARAALAAAGIDSAAVEADLLARHVLGLDHAGLILAGDRPVPATARRRLARLLALRLQRVPLQHLTREVDFRGLILEVGPDALIPRPETEGLVERVLGFLGENEAGPVLDVGTGTGCVALALAAARPRLLVWGTDLSAAAARLARRNARRLGLAGRVTVRTGDLLEPWRRIAKGRLLRALVSNPPYVAPRERRLLEPEVRDHEPAAALFAPGHGLGVIRRLVREGADVTAAGGLLAMEIGAGQGSAVERLLRDARGRDRRPLWRDARIEQDLAGRDRYALAERTG